MASRTNRLTASGSSAVCCFGECEACSKSARELELYSDWEHIYMWVKDVRETQYLELQSERNPFHRHRDSFDSEARCVQDLRHNFGSFPDLECKASHSETQYLGDAGRNLHAGPSAEPRRLQSYQAGFDLGMFKAEG